MAHQLRVALILCVWLLVFCPRSVWAQFPTLVTVQDTIYSPDGSRFNGYLILEWKTPQGVTVAQQSRSVRVVNGLVSISMIPNTAVTGSYYNAKYSSGGYIRLTERWNVPTSNTPLTIAEVRSSSTSGGGGTPGPGLGSVQITDVTGLSDELTIRPLKGTGFAASRTAVINASGLLDGASGSASDCLHVDGSSGPCGSGAGARFADSETPGGTMNGINLSFTLVAAPSPVASLQLFRNGLLLRQGADYSVSGSTITFVTGLAPQGGDLLTTNYRY